MPTITPDSQWFVVLDADGNCIAKYDTNASVAVPVEDFDVVELDSRSDLESYTYDSERGYQ